MWWWQRGGGSGGGRRCCWGYGESRASEQAADGSGGVVEEVADGVARPVAAPHLEHLTDAAGVVPGHSGHEWRHEG